MQLTDRERDLERLLQVSTRETANKEEEMRVSVLVRMRTFEVMGRQTKLGPGIGGCMGTLAG